MQRKLLVEFRIFLVPKNNNNKTSVRTSKKCYWTGLNFSGKYIYRFINRMYFSIIDINL